MIQTHPFHPVQLRVHGSPHKHQPHPSGVIHCFQFLVEVEEEHEAPDPFPSQVVWLLKYARIFKCFKFNRVLRFSLTNNIMLILRFHGFIYLDSLREIIYLDESRFERLLSCWVNQTAPSLYFTYRNPITYVMARSFVCLFVPHPGSSIFSHLSSPDLRSDRRPPTSWLSTFKSAPCVQKTGLLSTLQKLDWKDV